MATGRRRQHGTGSVYRRESDGKWVGSFSAGYTREGKRRRITVYGSTEAEAKRELEAEKRRVAREGAPAPEVRAGTTVRTWSATWLAETKKRLRPKTWINNKSQVERWIVPTIGSRKLDALTPTDIRAVAAAITDAGLAASSARRAHAILTKMLRAATIEGHAVPHRVLLVEGPTVSRSDRTAIPTPDAAALLDVAAALDDGSRWEVALLQGMRQAECLGLTWSHVDLDAATIDVSWQLVTLPYRIKGDPTSGFDIPDDYEVRHLTGAYHLARPKTSAGWRRIPMVNRVAEALAAWREVAPASPYDLVWPRANGGPRPQKSDDRAWYRLQDAARVAHVEEYRPGQETPPAGRRYTIHEARHTTATLLLDAGVDVRIVQAIVGHSSMMATHRYQHVSPDLARLGLEAAAGRLRI